VVYGGRL